MDEIKDYTDIIKSKLNTIQDEELRHLIGRLLEERDYLSEIANIDTLTGLNNRRILSHIRNYSGILMCDIDNFKSINDTYGHDMGDEMIKGVGRILKESTRSSDYVCRFGGDEFIVIFCDCPEEVLIERAEQIRTEVESKLQVPNTYRFITTSIGVAIKAEEETLTQTMKNADLALYESKNNGRNRVTVFGQEKEVRMGR